MPAAEDGGSRKDRIRGRAGTPLFPDRVNHRDDDNLASNPDQSSLHSRGQRISV